MSITKNERGACKALWNLLANDSGIVHVGIGLKRKDGVLSSRRALVVGVRKKLPMSEAAHPVPVQFVSSGLTMETDVEEYGTLHARSDIDDTPPRPGRPLELRPESKTNCIRPVPGGHSSGHEDITAGTLGCWMQANGVPVALSNNHVFADTNKAFGGDMILQPGPADGGTFGDRIGALLAYATIHMGEEPPDEPVPPPPPPAPPPPDEGKKVSNQAWKLVTGPANAIAKLLECDYRVVVINAAKRNLLGARVIDRRDSAAAVSQPWPNLIDAAISEPLELDLVKEEITDIGGLLGIADADIGMEVQKCGRTTGHTKGLVESIGMARVSYGEDGTALFADQLVIRGIDGTFSAGGDSGSAIVTLDNRLVGLLFAGGGGVTIANRISHVQAVLGVTL